MSKEFLLAASAREKIEMKSNQPGRSCGIDRWWWVRFERSGFYREIFRVVVPRVLCRLYTAVREEGPKGPRHTMR